MAPGSWYRSGDPDAAVEVTVAMREDGYIARHAQDAILGCPAGAAFQHAAMLVTQLIADHRPAPVRAPVPVRQPRDEAGQIIDASNGNDRADALVQWGKESGPYARGYDRNGSILTDYKLPRYRSIVSSSTSLGCQRFAPRLRR